jgi:hypothetical protein
MNSSALDERRRHHLPPDASVTPGYEPSPIMSASRKQPCKALASQPRRSAASVTQPDETHVKPSSAPDRVKVAHMRQSSIVRFVRDNLPEVLLSLVVAFALLGIMALSCWG